MRRTECHLDDLGPEDFQELVERLVSRVLGKGFNFPEPGPDAGRDAYFTGKVKYDDEVWSGYHVVQAKFRNRTSDPGKEPDATWARRELREELELFFDRPNSGRRQPEYYYFATNARLSSTGEGKGGLDRLEELLRQRVGPGKGQGLKKFAVWSYRKLCHLLAEHPDIRDEYGLSSAGGRGPKASWGGMHGSVPNPLAHYLPCPKKLAGLRDCLLRRNGARIALPGKDVVVVEGMGGVGKTVLVAELTRDPEVQRTFCDGIFWLCLRQQPNLLTLMNQLAGWLPGCGHDFTSESDARAAISQTLAGKRVLLILDDVWNPDHAATFKLVSAPGRLLVTTRKREVLVGLEAQEFRVDVLSPDESLRLLANWAKAKTAAGLPPEATEVARECGYLPLALASIGAMVRLHPTAWRDALRLLRDHDLEEFRNLFPDYPHPDLLRAIAVSVEDLPLDDQERYLDLAVFPEDEPIPEGPLQVLWGLAPVKVRACMRRLADRSLATLQQVGGNNALLLHDLQRDYIVKRRETTLFTLHARLLEGYRARCETATRKSAARGQSPSGTNETRWARGPDDGYYFQRLGWHMVHARAWGELETILSDVSWWSAKMRRMLFSGMASDLRHARRRGRRLMARAAIALGASLRSVPPGKLDRYCRHLRGAFKQEFKHSEDWLSPLRTAFGEGREPKALLFLGEALEAEEEFREAERVFRRMKECSPGQFSWAYSIACVRLAKVLGELNRNQEALQLTREVLRLRRGQKVHREVCWGAMHQEGIALRRLGRQAEARAVFLRVRKSVPRGDRYRTGALHQLGVIDLKLGNYTLAEKRFWACLREQANDRWNHRVAYDHRRLGEVYALTGRLMKAKAAFQRAMDISIRCGNRRYVREIRKEQSRIV